MHIQLLVRCAGARLRVGSRPVVLAAVTAGLLVAGVAPAGAAVRCEALAESLGLEGATITLSEMVEAGAFRPPSGAGGRPAFVTLPAFCRVAVTLKPTPQSDITAEVWLPAFDWNGKLHVAGNGGFAGTIGYAAMAAAMDLGYAAAGTDTGHTGPSSSTFANEEVVIDFAYRAVHETTAAAKRLVDRFYGEAPTFSYFTGCSTGGRQALVAAQRYPGDFDGIVAGAPAVETSRQVFGQIWLTQALRDQAALLPAPALQVLHDAVLNACDLSDGARDFVLERPMACTFDPGTLQCGKGGKAGACLSSSQVEAVRKIYAGAADRRTGEPVFPGLERGSELDWTPTPVGYAVDFFRYRVFRDPAWEPERLNFEGHLAEAAKPANQVFDAVDVNLTPFVSEGGKLLMYTGWSDPGIPPRRLVTYYEDVLRSTAGAGDAVRLFMVPGMGHCGGGEGTSTFDMLEALDRWVTSGRAPAAIPASRITRGVRNRTRPLCPYPAFAAYKGTGDTEDAGSFECRMP